MGFLRMRAHQNGFTLVELGIVLLVLVAALGIAIPVLVIEQNRNQMEKTVSQLEHLADAVRRWMRDNAMDPAWNGARTMSGPGRLPEPWSAPEAGDLLAALTQDPQEAETGLADRSWKGPYLSGISVDPWGSAYLVMGLGPESERVWVLSAGPDRRVETLPEHGNLQGDDLGIRLR